MSGFSHQKIMAQKRAIQGTETSTGFQVKNLDGIENHYQITNGTMDHLIAIKARGVNVTAQTIKEAILSLLNAEGVTFEALMAKTDLTRQITEEIRSIQQGKRRVYCKDEDSNDDDSEDETPRKKTLIRKSASTKQSKSSGKFKDKSVSQEPLKTGADLEPPSVPFPESPVMPEDIGLSKIKLIKGDDRTVINFSCTAYSFSSAVKNPCWLWKVLDAVGGYKTKDSNCSITLPTDQLEKFIELTSQAGCPRGRYHALAVRIAEQADLPLPSAQEMRSEGIDSCEVKLTQNDTHSTITFLGISSRTFCNAVNQFLKKVLDAVGGYKTKDSNCSITLPTDQLEKFIELTSQAGIPRRRYRPLAVRIAEQAELPLPSPLEEVSDDITSCKITFTKGETLSTIAFACSKGSFCDAMSKSKWLGKALDAVGGYKTKGSRCSVTIPTNQIQNFIESIFTTKRNTARYRALGVRIAKQAGLLLLSEPKAVSEDISSCEVTLTQGDTHSNIAFFCSVIAFKSAVRQESSLGQSLRSVGGFKTEGSKCSLTVPTNQLEKFIQSIAEAGKTRGRYHFIAEQLAKQARLPVATTTRAEDFDLANAFDNFETDGLETVDLEEDESLGALTSAKNPWYTNGLSADFSPMLPEDLTHTEFVGVLGSAAGLLGAYNPKAAGTPGSKAVEFTDSLRRPPPYSAPASST